MRIKVGSVNFELSKILSPSGTDNDIHIRNYTIQPISGSGAYGTVAPAVAQATGDAVAVKRLKTTLRDRERQLERGICATKDPGKSRAARESQHKEPKAWLILSLTANNLLARKN